MPDPSQSHSVLGFVVCWSKWGSENDTHCAGAGLGASVLVGSVVCQCSGQGQQQGPITLAQPIEDLEESSLVEPTIRLPKFRLVGERSTTAAESPVPAKPIMCGLPKASSVIAITAVNVPGAPLI